MVAVSVNHQHTIVAHGWRIKRWAPDRVYVLSDVLKYVFHERSCGSCTAMFAERLMNTSRQTPLIPAGPIKTSFAELKGFRIFVCARFTP